MPKRISPYQSPDILRVVPLDSLAVEVHFADGIAVQYSFKAFAEDKESVFYALHDPHVFQSVRVVHNAKAIQFPEEIDIHGSTLYHRGIRTN